MSERMNKEQAIEQIKKLINFTKIAREKIGTPKQDVTIAIGENQFYLSDDYLQALDIAIESLDNTMTNREYMHLVGVQAILNTKFDLDKPLQKEFVKFLYALNQVEPYERKE